MRRKLFLVTVLLGSFFVFNYVLAKNTDIVINEIGAYESVGNEWVELLNSGASSIDLTDWKFWENNTKHNLSVSSTDFSLDPGECGVICQDEISFLANNPSFSGSVFDSSWGSLKETGEEIGLMDENNDFIEQFSYITSTNFSLERINPFLVDYTSNNWQEHYNSNTVGNQNVVYNSFLTTTTINQKPDVVLEISTTTVEINEDILFSGLSSTDNDGNLVSWFWDFGDGENSTLVSTTYSYSSTGTFDIVLTVEDDDGGSSNTSTSVYVFNTILEFAEINTSTTSTVGWNNIKINEVVSDPQEGNEKVELFNNSTSTFDLVGGVICDSTESSCKEIFGIIAGVNSSDNFLVIDLGTDRYLNNNGDFVILKDDEGNKVDEISYGGSLSVPSKGQSISRLIDGADTDGFSDWAITTNVTLGSFNIINEPVSNPSAGGGGSNSFSPPTDTVDNDNSNEKGGSPECFASSSVVIYEILPNPKGDDSLNEFIKIKNLSLNTINLNGWVLKDLSKSFYLSGEIKSEEVLELSRAITSIALNNTTFEKLELIDVCENMIDELNYNEAEEEFVLQYKDGERKWAWGGENVEDVVNSESDTGIVWSINYPQTIFVGEKVLFDASYSADSRGGNLEFEWKFASSTLFGEKQEFEWSATGTFKIKIFATSSMGSVNQKEVEVFVGERLISESKVFISEVFANPEGADVREYIKIKNNSTSTIDISNWKIKYFRKTYQIPDITFIKPNDNLIFYKAVTKFSLSNSGGLVEFWNDKNNLVDSYEFAKSGQGEVATELTEDYLQKIVGLEIAKQSKKSLQIKRIEGLSLEEIKLESESGDLVKTKGRVIVLPGVFGSQYFYITDGKNGIQIYQHFKDFPELKVGDVVEVNGEVSIASGIKRIKVSGANKIIVIAVSGEEEQSQIVDKIDELNDVYLGSLVNVEGEITEIKSSYLFLDDGTAEIKVYFKPGSKITTSNFVVGEVLEVVGVLENTSSGFQVWPRSQDDIVVENIRHPELVSGSQSLTYNNSKETAEKYLTATGGGLTALILGFLARARGLMALGMIKKVAVAVGKTIIRRG